MSVEQLLHAQVTAAPQTYLPVTLPAISLIQHTLGTETVQELPEAVGGDGNFVYRLNPHIWFQRLPWGFRLEGRTLHIDPDVPTGAEVLLRYEATDGQGTTAHRNFSVLTLDAEMQLSVVTNTNVEIGCEPVVVARATPINGRAPYVYTLRGGDGYFAVYDGDVVAAQNTPAGRYDLELEVTDGGAGDQQRTLPTIHITRSDEVCPVLEPLPEAGESLPIGTPQTTFTTFRGVNFDLQLASVDSSRYKLEGLPEGLSFNPETQRLSGVLEAAGDFHFTYHITSPEGKGATLDYTIVNQTPTDEQTRFSARYVHLRDEIQNLYDSEHPLEFDVSFMAIYKDSLQIQAEFVESGGATTVIRAWQPADRGSFSLRQRGGVSTVALDPAVVGELLNLLQEGRTGIFVFRIRTRLEPGTHESVFPSENIPSQALEAEFTRLDIQDHTRSQQLEPEGLSLERHHLANSSVGEDKLASQAVRSNTLAKDAVSTEKLDDFTVTPDDLDRVSSDNITPGTVGAEQIPDGSITAAKLAGVDLDATDLGRKINDPGQFHSPLRRPRGGRRELKGWQPARQRPSHVCCCERQATG